MLPKRKVDSLLFKGLTSFKGKRDFVQLTGYTPCKNMKNENISLGIRKLLFESKNKQQKTDRGFKLLFINFQPLSEVLKKRFYFSLKFSK